MSGSDITLLVILCVAFAVALGVIIYNKVKGKSCCGDCNDCGGCGKEKKKTDLQCDGHCPHCSACATEHKNPENDIRR